MNLEKDKQYSLFSTEIKRSLDSLYSIYKPFLFYLTIIFLDLVVDKILTFNRASNLGFVIDFYFNFIYITYFYIYFTKNGSTFQFFLFFFLLKYLHSVSRIYWSLSLVASLFDYNSVLLNIGSLVHINLQFFNFLLSFLSGFVDFFFLLLLLKIIQLLLSILDLKFIFKGDIRQTFNINKEIII